MGKHANACTADVQSLILMNRTNYSLLINMVYEDVRPEAERILFKSENMQIKLLTLC